MKIPLDKSKTELGQKQAVENTAPDSWYTKSVSKKTKTKKPSSYVSWGFWNPYPFKRSLA